MGLRESLSSEEVTVARDKKDEWSSVRREGKGYYIHRASKFKQRCWETMWIKPARLEHREQGSRWNLPKCVEGFQELGFYSSYIRKLCKDSHTEVISSAKAQVFSPLGIACLLLRQTKWAVQQIWNIVWTLQNALALWKLAHQASLRISISQV